MERRLDGGAVGILGSGPKRSGRWTLFELTGAECAPITPEQIAEMFVKHGLLLRDDDTVLRCNDALCDRVAAGPVAAVDARVGERAPPARRQATQSPPAMVPQCTDRHCVVHGLEWGGRQSYFVVTTAATARSNLSCPAQPW